MRLAKSLCIIAAFLFLVLSGSFPASAQQPSNDKLPKIILSGMGAFKTSGPDAAIRAWLRGSSLENSEEALAQVNTLRQVQDFYGPYRSFHFIQSRKLTPTTEIMYFTLDFEKGPLFAKFTVYLTGAEWILVDFLFNTKEEQILPICP